MGKVVVRRLILLGQQVFEERIKFLIKTLHETLAETCAETSSIKHGASIEKPYSGNSK